MSARTYPREWFEVTSWSAKPVPCTFVKETPQSLIYASGQRYRKQTDWRTWYPTLEEAQAAIDVHNARKAKAEADKRIRDAAPELLEALEELFANYKALADSGDAGNWSLEDTPEGKKALAAIAKATGAA